MGKKLENGKTDEENNYERNPQQTQEREIYIRK